MAQDRRGFDPTQDVILDAEGLRGLAHPLRVQLLSALRLEGPATASQLGRRLGQSSGATSYHLRQLAAAGFVVDDSERNHGKERWWRAAHRSTYFDMADNPDSRAAGAEYMRAVARNYASRMLRFTDSVETVGEDYGKTWTDVYTLSDWRLELTAAQARKLQDELIDVIVRHQAEHRKAARGSRHVAVQVQLFPMPVSTA